MTSAAFIEALKTSLETRWTADPDFGSVTVHLWRADVQAPAVVLVRDRVTTTVEYDRMGPGRHLDATIPCLVGTIGSTMAEATDQAEAIVEDISDLLRTGAPSVGSQSWNAKVTNLAWLPLPSDKGGTVCDYEFDITYQADLD